MGTARTGADQVVVGVDRSDRARDAVTWAADLAAARGGSRRAARGSGVLSGSTSTALVGFARCPVVVTGPVGMPEPLEAAAVNGVVR